MPLAGQTKSEYHQKRVGAWGEAYAARLLEEKGYCLLERNARTPYGELDLVAVIDRRVVFVEVKTRQTASFGAPELAITPLKKQHLLNAATAYLQAHPELDGDWQIDVIAIYCKNQAAPEVTWFENAIS